MLNALGIAEVARTGRSAHVGNRVITIDDIVRRTTGADWVAGCWVELNPGVASVLAAALAGTVVDEPRALSASPAVIDGEIAGAPSRELSIAG